jgi:hypothetical protein
MLSIVSQPRLKATNSLQPHQLHRPRNQILCHHSLVKLLKLLSRAMSLDCIHIRITSKHITVRIPPKIRDYPDLQQKGSEDGRWNGRKDISERQETNLSSMTKSSTPVFLLISRCNWYLSVLGSFSCTNLAMEVRSSMT